MEVTADNLDWIHTDELALAAFLDTPTGRRLIPKLLEQTPTLLEGGDQNAILIRLGKVAGYSEVARTILALAHPAQKPSQPESEYAPLEDDSKWPKPPPEPAIEFVEPAPPLSNPQQSPTASTEQ